MVFLYPRVKGLAAYGTEGRGNFVKPVKARLTKMKFFLIFFGPVFPQEILANMASRRIDEIDYLVRAIQEIIQHGPRGTYRLNKATGEYWPEGFNINTSQYFDFSGSYEDLRRDEKPCKC